jgi:hypothetical protein
MPVSLPQQIPVIGMHVSNSPQQVEVCVNVFSHTVLGGSQHWLPRHVCGGGQHCPSAPGQMSVARQHSSSWHTCPAGQHMLPRPHSGPAPDAQQSGGDSLVSRHCGALWVQHCPPHAWTPGTQHRPRPASAHVVPESQQWASPQHVWSLLQIEPQAAPQQEEPASQHEPKVPSVQKTGQHGPEAPSQSLSQWDSMSRHSPPPPAPHTMKNPSHVTEAPITPAMQ